MAMIVLAVVGVIWAVETQAAGRWIMHLVTDAPAEAGAVGMPIDSISCPDTTGHWVWLIWYDPTAGVWTYNQANPYFFSNGSVDFQVPEFNSWYYLMLYDTVTAQWY